MSVVGVGEMQMKTHSFAYHLPTNTSRSWIVSNTILNYLFLPRPSPTCPPPLPSPPPPPPLFIESCCILSQHFRSASLNFICTSRTHSLPVTIILAISNGSFSSLLDSNSLRASARNLFRHGVPFSSHQWKALAVRRISRYRLRASALVMEDLRCLAMGRAVADPGSIIDGGMVGERGTSTSGEGWSSHISWWSG